MDLYTYNDLLAKVFFYENIGVDKGRFAYALWGKYLTEDTLRRIPKSKEEVAEIVHWVKKCVETVVADKYSQPL